jgi:hypothetical protein
LYPCSLGSDGAKAGVSCAPQARLFLCGAAGVLTQLISTTMNDSRERDTSSYPPVNTVPAPSPSHTHHNRNHHHDRLTTITSTPLSAYSILDVSNDQMFPAADAARASAAFFAACPASTSILQLRFGVFTGFKVKFSRFKYPRFLIEICHSN